MGAAAPPGSGWNGGCLVPVHPTGYRQLRLDEALRQETTNEEVFMRCVTVVLFSLLAVVVTCGAPASAQDDAVRDAAREHDREAIVQLSRDMVRAFGQRDAAAMAANWTEQGEYTQNGGQPIRGRGEIQKGYSEFFKTIQGEPKVDVQFDAVRYPSADVALIETTVRRRNEEGSVVASARQDAVLVRESGRWKLAVVREWDHDVGPSVSLKDLEWLIGTWRALTPDGEVNITYTWDENRAFIRGNFTVKEGAKVVQSGTETIGSDNADGTIRSWLFQSDGGFAGSVLTRAGMTWVIDVHGVRADGTKLSATVTYSPVDSNTFTWRAVNQALDGVAAADTPLIKVTKVNPAE
jgi:uncharacterized protein (TIGR02246 family)